MATHEKLRRFALYQESDTGTPAGGWWPASRSLNAELSALFEAWPPGAGRIMRVLYSPPDWDDRPRSVVVAPGRRVKTGCFPADDTHQITLSMFNGTRRVLTVIAPDAAPDVAAEVLAGSAARSTAGHPGP